VTSSKAIETVLLPGLYGTGELFDPLLRVAPEDSEITVVTYPSETGIDFDRLVEIAESRIPDDKPVQIVAESFSGLVAIRLLTRNNQNYKRVVFCATFASPPLPKVNWLINSILRLMRAWPGLVKFGVQHFCLNGSKSQSTIDPTSRAINHIPTPVLQERLEMIGSLNLIDELQQINIPSVYLLPGKDRLVPRRCAQGFIESMPSIAVHEIDGPHFLLQASPGVAAKVTFGENVIT